jgi:chemotaxis protein methyltransferase WspC
MGHPLIEALLRESMGLDVASVGSAAIDRALRDRMAASKLADAVSYSRLLEASPTEMQELIEAVVVPETWFFRNPDSFRALAKLTADEWVPSHPTGALRVLSFPCSTGEEPFSIAITLMEAGLSDDRFAIDGFDISRRALATASNGVYGRNSFRGAELAFRDRYFRQEKGSFILVDRVRRSVNFEQRNVIEEDFGNRGGYDVIFCRNVLIYFDQPTQQRVLRNLEASLCLNGILFVGPAESFQVAAAGFTSIPQPQAFAFRKAEVTPPALPAMPPALARPTLGGARGKRIGPVGARPRRAVAPGSEQPPEKIPANAVDDLALARRLADSGNLSAALERVEQALAAAPTAEGYHVLGLIRDATGDSTAAMESYRKALYLDPDHLDAMLHLAFLLERGGDAASAQRFRERARRAEERQ